MTTTMTTSPLFEGILHGEIWTDLSALLAPYPATATVAVAYIGSGADDLVTLTAGSEVFADISESAVRAGTTDPMVLERWSRNGVAVYHRPRLHTKLITARDDARPEQCLVAVGSANLSASSAQRLHETVKITRGADELRQAEEVIRRLRATSTQMSADDLAALRPYYRTAARPTTPGTAESIEETPFRPTALALTFAFGRGDASPEALRSFDEARISAGVGTEVDLAFIPHTEEMIALYSVLPYVGDHVLLLDHTGVELLEDVQHNPQVLQPGVVEQVIVDNAGNLPCTFIISRREYSAYQRTLDDVLAALHATGSALPRASHWIRDSRRVNAMLALWPDLFPPASGEAAPYQRGRATTGSSGSALRLETKPSRR
jgi:hypothetical protein